MREGEREAERGRVTVRERDGEREAERWGRVEEERTADVH